MGKTRQEILTLEACWAADPCWDLEGTEGYEEHREELLAFAERYREGDQRRLRKERLAEMRAMGVESNDKLYDRIRRLEYRLARLEGVLDGERWP